MSHSVKTRKIVARGLLALGLLAILSYGGVIGYFMSVEQSMVYLPSKAIREPRPGEEVQYTSVALMAADSTTLSGWRIANCNGANASDNWILFFHGNSGNVSTYRRWYRLFCGLGYRTLAIDYRGYGASDGIPSEPGIYSDARAAFDYLVEVENVPPDRVIVYGHSLGAAIAIEVAASRRPAALVVEGALISIPVRGQELYPFLPVSLIAKNRFDAAKRISDVAAPKLILHAASDTAAPIRHGYTLFQLAREPKQFIELKGNHGDAITVSADKIAAALHALDTTLHNR